MLNYRRFWPQSLLGLDIQADAIRLLQLQRCKEKQKVKQALQLELPSGAVSEGKIQNCEMVSEHLQQLVQSNSLQGVGVAIALPANCVITKRFFTLKGLRESELEAEVVSQLSQCFPGITEGLCYDYVTLNHKDELQQDLLLVATYFTHLNTPVTTVQNAGLKVKVVDVDSYALERANHLVEKNSLHVEEEWLLSCGLALRTSDV